MVGEGLVMVSVRMGVETTMHKLRLCTLLPDGKDGAPGNVEANVDAVMRSDEKTPRSHAPVCVQEHIEDLVPAPTGIGAVPVRLADLLVSKPNALVHYDH